MNSGLPPFLHDLLDRRVDPLADTAAQAWFLAHPEALERFAALQHRLSALPRPVAPAAPIPHRRPRWPWLVAAAMAVAILAAAVAAHTGEPGDPVPAQPSAAAPLPRPEFAPAAVRSWSASLRELEAACTRELRLDGHTRLQTERVPCAADAGTRSVTAHTIRQTTTAP